MKEETGFDSELRAFCGWRRRNGTMGGASWVIAACVCVVMGVCEFLYVCLCMSQSVGRAFTLTTGSSLSPARLKPEPSAPVYWHQHYLWQAHP